MATGPISKKLPAPVIRVVTDDVGLIKGVVGKGSLTDDTMPTISGTSVAGTKVSVYDLGVKIGETNVGTDGQWSFTPVTALSSGTHAFTAIATNLDGSGASAPQAAFQFKVGAQAVARPVITELVDDAGAIQGTIASGGRTDDTLPTLKGTATAGAKVVVQDNGTVLGNVTADATGHWSFTPAKALPQGAHVFTAVASNPDGSGTAKSLNAYKVAIGADHPSNASVVITADANNDGLLTQAEMAKGVGVKVSLPATAHAGDVLQLQDQAGHQVSHTITAADMLAKSYTLANAFPAAEAGQTVTISAKLTSKSGLVTTIGSDTAQVEAPVVVVEPPAPVVDPIPAPEPAPAPAPDPVLVVDPTPIPLPPAPEPAPAPAPVTQEPVVVVDPAPAPVVEPTPVVEPAPVVEPIPEPILVVEPPPPIPLPEQPPEPVVTVVDEQPVVIEPAPVVEPIPEPILVVEPPPPIPLPEQPPEPVVTVVDEQPVVIEPAPVVEPIPEPILVVEPPPPIPLPEQPPEPVVTVVDEQPVVIEPAPVVEPIPEPILVVEPPPPIPLPERPPEPVVTVVDEQPVVIEPAPVVEPLPEPILVVEPPPPIPAPERPPEPVVTVVDESTVVVEPVVEPAPEPLLAVASVDAPVVVEPTPEPILVIEPPPPIPLPAAPGGPEVFITIEPPAAELLPEPGIDGVTQIGSLDGLGDFGLGGVDLSGLTGSVTTTDVVTGYDASNVVTGLWSGTVVDGATAVGLDVHGDSLDQLLANAGLEEAAPATTTQVDTSTTTDYVDPTAGQAIVTPLSTTYVDWSA